MEKTDVCPNCGHENCNSLLECKTCGIICCVHCNACNCDAGFNSVEAIDLDCDLHEPGGSKS